MSIKEYGYEYDAARDDFLWNQTVGQVTTDTLWDALCLRSGRDALKAIAREYAPTVALLPALACDSMVLPFTLHGHAVRYYRLTPDYAIDVAHLRSLLPKTDTPILFLYMDYFGKATIDDDTLDNLRAECPQLQFIEDRTHNLLSDNPRRFQPEYRMASLRKWANVPDGGLLWAYKPLTNTTFGNDTAFTEQRLTAQTMRHAFLQNGDAALKPAFRQLFSRVSDILDSDTNPSRMSAYAYAMAQAADWHGIKQQRFENARVLTTILRDNPHVRLIQPVAKDSALYVPFLVSKRDEIQAQLSPMGIFNTIIWPLNDEQKRVCPIAKQTEETMLAAPCDQRYTAADMQDIGQQIDNVIRATCR
jgi:hypothetical protein